MAAPRKYNDAQRAAMFALHRQGCTPAEIARQCEAGPVSVARFSIPRRTVQSIVVGMAHELGDTGAQPDSDLSLEERINEMAKRLIGLVEREICRSERSRRQPVEATGQGRRDDEDVLGRVYQRPDARGKLVRSGGGFSRRYQEPQSHERRRLARGRHRRQAVQ
jgi:hypothetical protein